MVSCLPNPERRFDTYKSKSDIESNLSVLSDLLSPSSLDNLAKECGFITRNRKIKGSSFLYNLLSSCDHRFSSLQLQANEYAVENSIHISKEALHKRFNSQSSDFVLTVLKKVASLRFAKVIPLSNTLGNIKIKDSTVFQVDSRHESQFKGTGGKAGDAAVRIQLEYDVFDGSITDLDIRSGTEHDSKDARRKVGKLHEQTLYIRDLGYVSEHMMENIKDCGGYFLNRLKKNMVVYTNKQKKKAVSFSSLLAHMRKAEEASHEMPIYLSSSAEPYRLICIEVPESVYKQRVEQYKKENKGKTIGKELKARLHLNFYVTNISEKILPEEYVFRTYTLRWQIELVFKSWKSIFGIQYDSAMKTERFKTTLYAKLLMALLDWNIFYIKRKEVYVQYHVFLSQSKCMKHLFAHAQVIKQGIKNGAKEFERIVQVLTQDWYRLCSLEGQKKKHSYTNVVNSLMEDKHYTYFCRN